MYHDNNTNQLRREMLIRIAKLFHEGKLKEEIDRIPLALRPRGTESTRCCVYRDRAILKYRTMAMLGIGVEEETDEAKTLALYAEDALKRESVEGPVLTLLDEACSACVKSNYFITDACRGCLARPCTLHCPRKAISVIDGRAQIDISKCVNCGKCMQVCPYHAIIYVPIPCEEGCPVGAISKGEGGKEQINEETCIHCGACLRACPFGAIMEKSQIIDVLKLLKGDRPVVAMIAPAIMGQFAATLGQLTCSLKQLGFTHVAEVAWGADRVTEEESAEFKERMEKGEPLMTTSCCAAYTEMAKKHLPDLLPFVSHTPTPMHVTAEKAKELWPEAVRVFIGPCVAKKQEGLMDPVVDYVLTFEELGALFVAQEIKVEACDPLVPDLKAERAGRGFPVTGGVAAAVRNQLGSGVPLKPEIINGVTRQTFKKLKVYHKMKTDTNFLEVMTCEGGCVGGPSTITNANIATKKVQEVIDNEDAQK